MFAAITFDWSVSLGQIVNAVLLIFGVYGAVIRMYHVLDKRASAIEQTIKNHGEALTNHAIRMERWETTLFKVVSDLQRVIGRMEVSAHEPWHGPDRRVHNRD